METLLPSRRPASKHPRRAKRSQRGSQAFCTRAARPCAASQKPAIGPLADDNKSPQRRFIRNQQYSINAVSEGGGSVVERYAYSAYGQVTIADASGTEISDSAISNRYTYTGREWDEGLNLYHYRARMYDAVGGRFCSRDPIGYVDRHSLYRAYFVPSRTDQSGLVCIECTFRHSRVGSRIETVTTDCSGGDADSGGATDCCGDVNPGTGGSSCYTLTSWKLCDAEDDTPAPPPCWDCGPGEYAYIYRRLPVVQHLSPGVWRLAYLEVRSLQPASYV